MSISDSGSFNPLESHAQSINATLSKMGKYILFQQKDLEELKTRLNRLVIDINLLVQVGYSLEESKEALNELSKKVLHVVQPEKSSLISIIQKIFNRSLIGSIKSQIKEIEQMDFSQSRDSSGQIAELVEAWDKEDRIGEARKVVDGMQDAELRNKGYLALIKCGDLREGVARISRLESEELKKMMELLSSESKDLFVKEALIQAPAKVMLQQGAEKGLLCIDEIKDENIKKQALVCYAQVGGMHTLIAQAKQNPEKMKEFLEWMKEEYEQGDEGITKEWECAIDMGLEEIRKLEQAQSRPESEVEEIGELEQGKKQQEAELGKSSPGWGSRVVKQIFSFLGGTGGRVKRNLDKDSGENLVHSKEKGLEISPPSETEETKEEELEIPSQGGVQMPPSEPSLEVNTQTENEALKACIGNALGDVLLAMIGEQAISKLVARQGEEMSNYYEFSIEKSERTVPSEEVNILLKQMGVESKINIANLNVIVHFPEKISLKADYRKEIFFIQFLYPQDAIYLEIKGANSLLDLAVKAVLKLAGIPAFLGVQKVALNFGTEGLEVDFKGFNKGWSDDKPLCVDLKRDVAIRFWRKIWGLE